jgi:hypothetical protein
VSRAAIVRVAAVREVLPHGAGPGRVRFDGGVELEVSRRRYADLLRRLE